MKSKRITGFQGPDAALLTLSTLAVAASLDLVLSGGHAVYCDRLAPLAVLAVLSALLIVLGFRALSRAGRRLVLGCALAMAAISLFADARFLVRYHGPCAEVQRQIAPPRAVRALFPGNLAAAPGKQRIRVASRSAISCAAVCNHSVTTVPGGFSQC